MTNNVKIPTSAALTGRGTAGELKRGVVVNRAATRVNARLKAKT